jgi:hypothetical protein
MLYHFEPTDPSFVRDLSLFVDINDMKLKFKGLSGTTHTVDMTSIPNPTPTPVPQPLPSGVSPVPLFIQDNSGYTGNVYFSIIGLQNDQWNVDPLIRQWSYMDANGNPQVVQSGQDFSQYFHKIEGNSFSGNVPFFFSGRVTFAFGEIPSYYPALSPSGLPMPSTTSTGDSWWFVVNDKIEFTNKNQALGADVTVLDCNTTLVDGFGLPILLSLTGTDNGQQSAGSLTKTRSEAFAEFNTLDQAYTDQIVLSNGQSADNYVRILSPQMALSRVSGNGPMFPADLMDPYIDEVWNFFSQPGNYFNVNLDAYAGFPYGTTTSGNVVDGVLTFPDPSTTGNQFTINKPSTTDLMSCNGVFNVTNPVNGTWDGNIKTAVAGAMNRGVATLPKVCDPNNFYSGTVHNEYAFTVHDISTDHINYAFPYDDACNLYSSNMADGNPQGMTITLQPWYTGSAA